MNAPWTDATAIGLSGFFLRDDAWARVRGAFTRWACVDACRDDPSTTLHGYVDAAIAAIDATPGPHVLLAHSFGGWLAAAVAARMATPPSHVVLLGALGLSPGLSAAEHAASTGDDAMSALCRLDLDAGVVRLVDETAFGRLLGAGPAFAPRPSPVEPFALLADALPADATPVRGGRTRRWYVAAAHDALVGRDSQRVAAHQHAADLLFCDGGHLAPLHDLRWIDTIARALAPPVAPTPGAMSHDPLRTAA